MDGGAPTMQRGGGFHGKSSYFSVDVFVDYLEAARLPCRVPSVSFQFLDFPAITVYSPTAGEIQPGDAQRHSFNQGKSCVFEMVEYDLHERMRREPLRLAWVDSWQLKDKELASTKLPMVTGMDRKVRGRPAHVQQGKFRLHDPAGQPVCVVQLRCSVVTHGNALQPELLKQRDYRTAPRAQHGLRDDWQPIIKRLVREYHETVRPGEARGAGGTRGIGAAVGGRDVNTEQIIRKSESVLTERLDGISRRMAQVQRTNLELSSAMAKLEENGPGAQASVQDRVRIAQLEEDNRKLQEQMVEMARLQVTSARGLQPTQVLQAIKFQVSELLKLNPTFDLQAVFDAFDLDGDGVVSTDEFVVGLRELGIALEPTQIPAVLELLPTDSRGQIGYKTFVALFGGKEQHVLTDITNQVRHIFAERGLQLKQAFRAMDTNHDGVISREEFAQGLKALQIDLHPDKLMEFLRLVDADVDGMINYYDFVQHFGTAKDGWDWAVTAAVHDQQLRTSLEWAVLRGQNDPVVISPDGWDRSDLQRSLLEPITLSTYLRRLNQSETRNPARTPGGDAADSASREQSSTGVPSDNTVWMRESLDPTLRDSERPYVESDPDEGYKASGTDPGIHRDGYDCPPALMFINTPSPPDATKPVAKTTPATAGGAKAMHSPAQGGGGGGGRRSGGTASGRNNKRPSGGRGRQGPSSASASASARGGRGGRPRSKKQQSRGASREVVLDVLSDQVSYANSTAHAASLLPKQQQRPSSSSGQVSGYADGDSSVVGQGTPTGRKSKPRHGSKPPKQAWLSSPSEDEGSSVDNGGAMFSPPKRGPRSSPARSTPAGRRGGSPRSSKWAASRASLEEQVVDFLSTICPGGKSGRQYTTMYSEALQELGVVEMADLELLDETDLRGVGVPLIDARRLLRAVKHSAGGAVGGVPAAEYGAAIASALASFDGSNARSAAETQLAATMQKAAAAVAAAGAGAGGQLPSEPARAAAPHERSANAAADPYNTRQPAAFGGINTSSVAAVSATSAGSAPAPFAPPRSPRQEDELGRTQTAPPSSTRALPTSARQPQLEPAPAHSQPQPQLQPEPEPPRAATPPAPAPAPAPAASAPGGEAAGLSRTYTPAPTPAPAPVPVPAPAQRAKEQAAAKGEESAVAKYAREKREAQAKQDAEAKAAEEAKAAALKKQQEAEAKAAAEAKAREQAALQAKLDTERREREAQEKKVRLLPGLDYYSARNLWRSVLP